MWRKELRVGKRKLKLLMTELPLKSLITGLNGVG